MTDNDWNEPLRTADLSAAEHDSGQLSGDSATKPLIELLAAAFTAWGNCQRTGRTDWQATWLERMESLCAEHLPSGSGFNNGSAIELDASRPDRLCFTTGFHHMNDGGYYDGWTQHRVIVSPAFIGGFELKVTGRDKRGIKEYIGEAFQQALSTRVLMPD